MESYAWSAITPGDFGLVAAFWSGADADGVEFRPIIGWVTYSSRSPARTSGTHGFFPVILESDFPNIANAIANFAGTLPAGIEQDEAKRKLAMYRARAPGSGYPPPLPS